MLCAVCHITGGLSFRPKTVNEGCQIIDKSAFLNYEERQNYFDPIIPGNLITIPSRIQLDMINENFMNKARDNAKFDEDVQNKFSIQAYSNVRLATPRSICAKNANCIIPNPRQRRILRELHYAMKLDYDHNSHEYNPDIKIYPFQSNLDKWKVYIYGPEGSEYEKKWWYMHVTFPDQYPVEPPDFRYVTIPYHLNISVEGRICLNLIQKGYDSSIHVVDIIQQLLELFLLPSDETPVQFEVYDLYRNNRTQYDKLARESCRNAKDKIDDYIDDSLVSDEVPKDFNPEKHFPQYMMSQISVEKRHTEKIVMASSGVFYYKDELRELVSSSENPVCTITGKILTEKLEDLI